MSRPRKSRRICRMPEIYAIAPLGTLPPSVESVIMTIDEYESIRLLDLEGLTQEECATQMQISRASVATIIESARRKLSEVLVCGKVLYIRGGEVFLCENRGACCGKCGKATPDECKTCENYKHKHCESKT